MLTSSIFSPSDCTAEALADFEKLVLEGGAVNPQGLTQRIRNAFRLLFLRTSDGQLVGVGALKHPCPSTATGCSPMRKQPPHQTNTVWSWVGWSWLKRTKGKDCRRALSVNYSLSRRTRMFSRPPGPMSALCVMRLTMDSKSTGNPTRAGAATTLFSIFGSRRDFPTRSDLC